MTHEEILLKVNDICKEVFFDEDLVITDDTTADDVAEWDSLTHLQLILEVEQHFGIKFTMGEVQGFQNVGDLVDVVSKKLN